MTEHPAPQASPSQASRHHPVESKRARRSFQCTTTTTPASSSPSPAMAPLPSEAQDEATMGSIATPPCAADTNPLRDFLVQDIKPCSGNGIILPFLTTSDRLRLSKCSRDLMKYRFQLSRVKVVPHPSKTSPSPATRAGLVQLLAGQRAGMELLRVSDKSLLWAVEGAASSGVQLRIQALDLSGLQLARGEEGPLVHALEGGALRALECLDMSESGRASVALDDVVRALGQGACPRLRRLNMRRTYVGSLPHEHLGVAMEAGHMACLEELDLSGNRDASLEGQAPEAGSALMCRALERGCCPRLRALSLSKCFETPRGGEALGRALRSGRCASLEHLDMSSSWAMCEGGLVPVLEAIEAGGCPRLRTLDLNDHNHLMRTGCRALSRALSSGACRGLHCLRLRGTLRDQEGAAQVIKALTEGACPELRELNLSGCYIGTDNSRILGDSLQGGSWPWLLDLGLSGVSMGDEALVVVAGALEAGRCPSLQRLNVQDNSLGPASGIALARAIASGHLQHLKSLNMAWNWHGDQAMAQVVGALRLSGGWMLHDVDFANTGMGREAGQALLQGLRDKHTWPDLKELELSFNDLGHAITGVAGLAETLEEEGACQRLQCLGLCNSGMSREGGERLCKALRKEGVCPMLRRLRIGRLLQDVDFRSALEPRLDKVMLLSF